MMPALKTHVLYLLFTPFNFLLFLSFLPERVGEKLYLYLRTYALVQYIIYSIEYRHVDVQVTVDFLHAFRTEISLGNHLHLYLCALHRVSLSYHGTKGAVAREV